MPDKKTGVEKAKGKCVFAAGDPMKMGYQEGISLYDYALIEITAAVAGSERYDGETATNITTQAQRITDAMFENRFGDGSK